jgi:Leu/Phe-tRNA-protein transferase
MTGKKFYTKESHDKWYAQWMRAIMTDKEMQLRVDEDFRKKMKKELYDVD